MTRLTTKCILVFLALMIAMQAIAPISAVYAQTTTPPATPAIQQIECGLSSIWSGDIACFILAAINYAIDGLAWIPTNIASGLFNILVEKNKSDFITTNAAVTFGWGVARDTANLFFIIILIISALATIFDLASWHIKSVLGKFILIALLINFSMVIGKFVIDQSNLLADVFYQAMLTTTDGSGNKYSFSGAISSMTDFKLVAKALTSEQGILNSLKANATPEEFKQAEKTTAVQIYLASLTREQRQILADFGKITQSQVERFLPLDTATLTSSDCGDEQTNFGSSLYESTVCQTNWKVLLAAQLSKGANFKAQLAIQTAMKLIVYPVAIFVLFAGSFLLLHRLVALAFILILAPLAFLSYAVPGQSKYWSEWWTSLFKNAFFFPAFMFFLMVSIIFFKTYPPNIEDPASIVFSYFMGIGLLVASMIAAQKMGANGAGTVMGLAKRYGNNVKGYAQKTGWRAGGAVSEKALRDYGLGNLARIPLIGRQLVRPLEKVREKGEKVREDREKRRVEALRTAASIGGDYAATRFRGMKQSDKEEFIDKAKPRELEKTFAELSAVDIMTATKDIKNPKTREKAHSAIKDLDKRIEVESGWAESGRTVTPQAYIDQEREGIKQKREMAEDRESPELFGLATQQERELEGKLNEDALATARVLGNMTSEDQRSITAKDMEMKSYLREAIAMSGQNTTLMRNLGNDPDKVKQLRSIFIEKSGMDQNVDLTAPEDLTVKSETLGGEILLANDDVRRRANEILIRNTTTGNKGEEERTNEMMKFLKDARTELANQGKAFQVKSIENQYGNNPALRANAYDAYFKQLASQLMQSTKTNSINANKMVRELGRNLKYQQTAKMLNQNPNMIVSIANEIPLSNRTGETIAAAQVAAAPEPTPPPPPPPTP